MALKTVPLASLVEDMDLYPRVHIDSVHVSDLVRAVEGGAQLPPIVADERSKRIVDGFHRNRLWWKVLGDTGEVLVDFRRYKNEAELFLAAVDLNSAHGRKLDRQDQARIVTRAKELGVNDRKVAVSLHVPEARVQHLQARVIYGPASTWRPAKRGMRHLHGTRLSKQQVSVVSSVRSGSIIQPARELIGLLNSGLGDLSDAAAVESLEELRGAIDRALEKLPIAS